MYHIEPQTAGSKKRVAAWVHHACACAPALGDSRRPATEPHPWWAQLDVHMQTPNRRRPRVALGTARAISDTGLELLCRQPLPLYSRIVICLAAETEGVRGKVTSRTQTLGGFILQVEFEFEQADVGIVAA